MTSSGAVLAEKSSKLSLGNRNGMPTPPHPDVNLPSQPANLLTKSTEEPGADGIHPRSSSAKRRASSHVPSAKKMRSGSDAASDNGSAVASTTTISTLETSQEPKDAVVDDIQATDSVNASLRESALNDASPVIPTTQRPAGSTNGSGEALKPTDNNGISISASTDFSGPKDDYPKAKAEVVELAPQNDAQGSVEDGPEVSVQDVLDEAPEEAVEEAAEEAGDEILEEDEDADAEEDEEDEAGDAERVRAIDALTKIEILFANFRNKLHDQQMARFELEISMCDKGTHPELLAYKSSLKTMNDERLARSQSHLAYQKQCITNQTRAMRTQVLQTYIYNKFNLQSRLLSKTTSLVYRVNSERRAMDKRHYSLPQLAPRFEASPAALAQSQLIDYVGFPAAPALSNATEGEELDDLRQLGLR